MQDVLKIFLISLVTSVAVLFALGPLMLRLQAGGPLIQPQVGGTPAPTTVVVPSEPLLTAPNVEGMAVDEARARWSSQGITVIEDGRQADASQAAGTVLEQRPAAGAPLEHKEIRVIVASAPEAVQVPDVLGQGEDDARHALVEAGFEVPPAKEVAPEDGGDLGQVSRQDPNPGAQVDPGSKVQLFVTREGAPAASDPDSGADGELVEVPKVLRQPLSKARTRLEKAGLAVGRISKREDEEMSGRRVIEQSPAAGQRVPEGTKVDLVIVAPD